MHAVNTLIAGSLIHGSYHHCCKTSAWNPLESHDPEYIADDLFFESGTL